MREAGYSHSSSECPGKNVIQTKFFKKEMPDIIKKMEEQRDKALNRMDDTVNEASHSDVARSVDIMTKNIQLLSQKPTEITKHSGAVNLSNLTEFEKLRKEADDKLLNEIDKKDE